MAAKEIAINSRLYSLNWMGGELALHEIKMSYRPRHRKRPGEIDLEICRTMAQVKKKSASTRMMMTLLMLMVGMMRMMADGG